MYQIYGEKCSGQREPNCLSGPLFFSWKLKSDRTAVHQRSYQIYICMADGAQIWTSGLCESGQIHNVPYIGPELKSNMDYQWYVRSVSNYGDIAEGKRQFFSTGILRKELWKAKWIEPDYQRRPCEDETEGWKVFAGLMPYLEKPEDKLNPCMYFRREWKLTRKVRQAKIYATAHGIYKLFVNGVPYGIPLAPGYTVYDKYLEYQKYDITESLQSETLVLGAIVADGWYLGKIGLMGIGNQYGSQLALFLQIMITYEDGSQEVLGTDEQFMAGKGAYMYADLFVGEGYDEGKSPVGWMDPGFSCAEWKPVICKDYGTSHLKGSADEGAAFIRMQDPANIQYSPKGELMIDVGENIAGVLAIEGVAQKGDRITLEYSEVLDQNGNFQRNIMGQNKNQTDVFVAGKDGSFTFLPYFTYHGFQFVRITGIQKEQLLKVKVCVLASNLDKTGDFICSNFKLNQLQKNIFRSQQGNMLYVPTDCPQRERAGWTGDMQIYAPTAVFLMDMEGFLRKWLENMRLEQLKDGQIPHVIPNIPSNMQVVKTKECCSSGWGDACVIVPYRLYQAYGDIEILRENYSMMQKWMRYIEKKAGEETPQDYGTGTPESKERQKYLWNTGFHFGDWLIPSLTKKGASEHMKGAEMTKELVAPAMWAYTTKLMAEISKVLNDKDSYIHYKELRKKICCAYEQEYLLEDGRFKADFQGVYVLALAMDLVSAERKELVLKRLMELIKENQGCLDTGFLSMPFLLDVLCENGKSAEAYSLLYQEKCPSWFYEINKGANTIWESWNNIKENGERGNASYNHFAFGCIGDFIYRRILGVQRTEPGYRKIRIQPDFSCGLEWACGRYESIYGTISVSWSKLREKIVLDIELPPGVTADISAGNIRCQRESGRYHLVG